MAPRSKAQTPEARTISVKGLVDDIDKLYEGAGKASASPLERKRAKMMLAGIRLIIEAQCLAPARRADLGNLNAFEVRPRGAK
jgi:hypothetical protein